MIASVCWENYLWDGSHYFWLWMQEEKERTATKPCQITTSRDISSYATTSIMIQNKAILNLLTSTLLAHPNITSSFLTPLGHFSLQLMFLLLRTHITPWPTTCQREPSKTAEGSREFQRGGTFWLYLTVYPCSSTCQRQISSLYLVSLPGLFLWQKCFKIA